MLPQNGLQLLFNCSRVFPLVSSSSCLEHGLEHLLRVGQAGGLVEGLGAVHDAGRGAVHGEPEVHPREAALGLGPWHAPRHGQVAPHGQGPLVRVLALGALQQQADRLQVGLQVLPVRDQARVLADLVEPLGGDGLHGPPHQRVEVEDGVEVFHR